MRIALFYPINRPYCTGAGVHAALAGMGQAVTAFDSWDVEWARNQKLVGFDLYLEVCSSARYKEVPLPDDAPSAYWAIDTGPHFEQEKRVAEKFDWIFAAAKKDCARLKEAFPEKKIRFLPLAADERFIRDWKLPRKYDVAFVGSEWNAKRKLFRRFVERNFANGFFKRVHGEEMGKAYGSAKIGLNQTVFDVPNIRCYEVAGCGAMLLTNPLPETRGADGLKVGKHFVEYETLKELQELIGHYLENGKEREKIAHAGQEEVLGKHLLKNRAKEILKALGSSNRDERLWL